MKNKYMTIIISFFTKWHMMHKIFFTISLTGIIYFMSCNDNPITPKYNKSFAIYFLKDSTIKIRNILDKDLSQLELADKPWLAQEDIEFYDWSSHCIYLKKDKSYLFPNYYKGFYQLPKSWTDRPWIVLANNIPCYKGYFSTDASIDIFQFPEINALHAGLLPQDIISSNWNFWFFSSDPRDNEVVKKALNQIGLYHGGIEVSLDTTNSQIKVFNNDTTAVEYILNFKNNDQDNLFIFDPDKVESEIFHFYNNGPNFLNVNTGKSYGSQYMKTRKPDGWPNEWNSNWYTLLKSGESIKRTIRLKGYPFIPQGIYWVQTSYGTPKHSIEKNIRATIEGRYYIAGGENQTNIICVTITN